MLLSVYKAFGTCSLEWPWLSWHSSIMSLIKNTAMALTVIGEIVPPTKIYVGLLMSITSECDLIWRLGLYGGHCGGSQSSTTGILIKGGKMWTQIQTCTQ